jgi:hypothetical protein
MKGKLRMKSATFEKVSEIAKKTGMDVEAVILEIISQG